MFKHNFDFGMYYLYKDNKDGTALFYEVEELGENINPIKPENRLIKYKWESMTKI